MQDLRALGKACPRLHSLNVSSCRYLAPDALEPLLQAPAAHPAGTYGLGPTVAGTGWGQSAGLLMNGFGNEGAALGPMLPELTELDVSYCPLPTAAICRLLGNAPRLTVSPSAKPYRAFLSP